MRPAIVCALSAGLFAPAATIAWFVFSPAVPQSAPPPPPVPVVTAPVQQRDVGIVLNGLGTVTALNSAVIRTQITGVIQSVDFIEGQTVRRGDKLAQVDPRPSQAVLDQAEAQLSRDESHLANARVNLGRDVPLLKTGDATAQTVANQTSQVAQWQSQLNWDRAAVANARTQLGYTTLTAPFDGLTGVRALDVGNVIHPTDAAGLVTETQVQPISVVFILPAAAIGQVQAALARGPVPAVAFDQAGTHKLDSGELLLINNQADPATGTVELKAIFANPHLRLWPGVFVNVELTVRTQKAGLVIPADAVQQGEDGEFVFVVGADNKVEVHPITVTQRNRGVALVQSGLRAGQTVVVQGQYRLVPGTVVATVAPDQVSASSAASAGLLP